MPSVTVKLTFSFNVSRYKDGRCYCGAEPRQSEQTFTAGSGVKRKVFDGVSVIVDNSTGTNTNELWDSAATVTWNKLPLLSCVEGHYYVTHAEVVA